MAQSNSKQNGSHARSVVAVGAEILAAAAVGAAGVYFLTGKHGAKNRKIVKGWMLKAKGEILEEMEKLGRISEKSYHEIVNRVAKKYESLKHVDRKDLEKMASDLKRQWKHFERRAAKQVRKIRR